MAPGEYASPVRPSWPALFAGESSTNAVASRLSPHVRQLVGDSEHVHSRDRIKHGNGLSRRALEGGTRHPLPNVREHTQLFGVPETRSTRWRLTVARTTEKKGATLASPEAGQVVTVSSTEAQNGLGELLDRVARGARVVVTRYNRRHAVILSAEEYDTLMADEEVDLSTLEREFDQLVARMQTPEHRDAVDALFQLSGEELGEAAAGGAEADRDDP